MNKDEIINQMLAAGWRRHDGTEWGEAGKPAKGKQHKESARVGLGEVRSINAWLRQQDEWWVSPDGSIIHWSQSGFTTIL